MPWENTGDSPDVKVVRQFSDDHLFGQMSRYDSRHGLYRVAAVEVERRRYLREAEIAEAQKHAARATVTAAWANVAVAIFTALTALAAFLTLYFGR